MGRFSLQRTHETFKASFKFPWTILQNSIDIDSYLPCAVADILWSSKHFFIIILIIFANIRWGANLDRNSIRQELVSEA